MARVNHKKIKQLIAQKQKTITDRQFFTSRALAAHLEDIAAAQTKRYGYRRRVKVRTVWKSSIGRYPAICFTSQNSFKNLFCSRCVIAAEGGSRPAF